MPPPRPSSRPSSAGPISRDRDRLIAWLLAATAAGVFLPALACGFVNVDDPKYVLQNPLVLGGLSAAGVLGAWSDVVFANWAPLTILSLQLDATLFGTRPWGYHLTNVLLHAATTGVFFLALSRMTGAPGRSAAAAFLFAVHPLRVESVAWIAERKDVLSVFFLAVALLAYERYARRPTLPGYLAVAAAMLASLLSKATAVTLPVLLLVLDAWPLRRADVPGCGAGDASAAEPARHARASWRHLVAEKLPLLAVAAVFSVVTLVTNAGSMQSGERMPMLTVRIPNAITAVAAYLRETALPVALQPVHRHTGAATVSAEATIVSAAAILTAAALAWRLRNAVPACAAGLAWFLLALAPVLGVVTQLGFASRADRFTYVPHMGLMVALVWTAAAGLARVRAPKLAAPVLFAVAAAGCIVATRLQIDVWSDSVSLWTHVAALEPPSTLVHLGLGEAWYDRGDDDRAIEEFRRSLVIEPTARTHDWLALALARKGLFAEALEQHAAATALDPNFWEAHNNAGITLARMGRMREALERFERAAAIAPDDPEVRRNLAQARAELASPAGP